MTFGSDRKGKKNSLTASISLPKSGFVPGERVLFHARIVNETKKKLKGIRIELVEVLDPQLSYMQQRAHILLLPGGDLQAEEDSLFEKRAQVSLESAVL